MAAMHLEKKVCQKVPEVHWLADLFKVEWTWTCSHHSIKQTHKLFQTITKQGWMNMNMLLSCQWQKYRTNALVNTLDRLAKKTSIAKMPGSRCQGCFNRSLQHYFIPGTVAVHVSLLRISIFWEEAIKCWISPFVLHQVFRFKKQSSPNM